MAPRSRMSPRSSRTLRVRDPRLEHGTWADAGGPERVRGVTVGHGDEHHRHPLRRGARSLGDM